MDKNLLLSRGFKSKKQLLEFLDNCTDENWKKELSEFYGLPYEDESEDEKDDDLTLDFDDEDEEEEITNENIDEDLTLDSEENEENEDDQSLSHFLHRCPAIGL